MVALGSDQTVDDRPRCTATGRDPHGGHQVACKQLPTQCRRTGLHVSLNGTIWSFEVDTDHELSLTDRHDPYAVSCTCGWEGVVETAAADHARQNGLCGACWGSGVGRCPECAGVGTVEAQDHLRAALPTDGG